MHIFTRLEAFIIRDDIGLVYRAVSTRNMMRSEVRRSTARKEVAECGIGDCAVDKRKKSCDVEFYAGETEVMVAKKQRRRRIRPHTSQ
jgi:hypothetical protein